VIVDVCAGDLVAGVVDNTAHLDKLGHGGGYNGLAWLTSKHRAENLFVPKYAGMNLELYFDGAEENFDRLFEPRRSPMSVRRLGPDAAELHQPPTPHFGVESWTTFRLVGPHYVDFEFRAIPRSNIFEGAMGVFWASYIYYPEDIGLYFPTDSAEGERWIRHYSPEHGIESTHTHREDDVVFTEHPPIKAMMNRSFSPWRFTQPYYFGLSHGMVYAFMVDDAIRDDGSVVRFTQSPTGGGPRCPAWDYQLVVPHYEVDAEYRLSARVVYKPFAGANDITDEFQRWQDGRS
jgi:hypothetical protein